MNPDGKMCAPEKDTVRSLVEENAKLSSEVISLLGITLKGDPSTVGDVESASSLLSDVNDRLCSSNYRLREVISHLKEVL